MSTKNMYFTSDWHVGHASVIKFDNRPFRDVDHMHDVLINNFNSCVRGPSVTYFLGDMGFNTDALKEVVKCLNGTKVLILGNHDKGMTSMYNIGFDVVLNTASFFVGKNKVTMSHCPLPGIKRESTHDIPKSVNLNWHGELISQKYVVPNEGQFHLHGHIHSPNNGKSQKILDKQYDVGVAANNYRPVSFSQVESFIAQYLRDHPNG